MLKRAQAATGCCGGRSVETRKQKIAADAVAFVVTRNGTIVEQSAKSRIVVVLQAWTRDWVSTVASTIQPIHQTRLFGVVAGHWCSDSVSRVCCIVRAREEASLLSAGCGRET